MNKLNNSRPPANAAGVRPLDDDEYALSQPVKRPAPTPIPPAESRSWPEPHQRVLADDDLPPPPRWPMLGGIFTFPFYLNTLETLTFISLGLMVTGWMLMFWIAYGSVGGGTTARLLGLPPLAAGILTLGYAASCCFSIIEETSYGLDSIEIQSGLDWKEWIWSFARVFALGMQACMVGGVVQWLIRAGSPLPLVAVAFAAFPFVLLGALAAGGAWTPLAIVSVLRSLPRIWRVWGLFFLETTPLAVLWTQLTVEGLRGRSPWLTPLYSAPLLAAIILIYARLVGRLAGCIMSTSVSTQGADDDEAL